MARPDAKTVVRPPGGRADLAVLARPLVAFGVEAERAPRPDPAALAAELRARVEAFETAAHRAGLRAEAILDARDALVAVIDARARSNPGLDQGRWARGLRAALPAVEVADGARIESAAGRAETRGDREGARFLRHCREGLEAARPVAARRRGWAALAVGAFLALLVAWVGWAEWRFRERLLAALPDVEAVTAAARAAPLPVRVAELDAFAEAVARVERRAGDSPVGLVARLPFADPGGAARARRSDLAAALVPEPVAEALGVALATEGDAVALYDALRAAAILGGSAEWQPSFLAGWVRTRVDQTPLARLAPHVAAMAGPPGGIVVSDPETLREARRFAAEAGLAERAYLEMARSEQAARLRDWLPVEAVPGLETVLVRRSGAPIGQGVPGLFTAAGWAMARDGGAEAALAQADAQAAALLGEGGVAEVESVLDILQRETLAAWRAYVADLRVRPFTDQPEAVMISGTLGVRDTPLARLIREVWRQAGGEDRSRSHASQLRIAAEFGPAIQFVEQGRMAEIARLFASLNVALQVLDADADLAAERLMDLQARAASIAALNQAPLLVVQIVEDVLAQTAASNQALLGNRAMRQWQAELGPACASAIDGHYPFGPGPDAEPGTVARLIGPEGEIARFFAAELAPVMEMGASPWRWKPEARLSGFLPESAAFFERIAGLGPALAAVEGAGTTLTLTALAQRGAPTVAIGGQAAPVVTSGAPVTLAWPGPEPARGFEIAFDNGARAEAPGPWGMLRFLDKLRLRPRSEGRRFLLDIRVEAARAYLQMDFPEPVNPVSARPLLAGLACPARL